jgi:four helix bundle protein
MRRASVSIVSNIAEGAGRGGKDFSRFLRMALGSASELEAQLQLCNDLLLIGPSDVDFVVEQTTEVQGNREPSSGQSLDVLEPMPTIKN